MASGPVVFDRAAVRRNLGRAQKRGPATFLIDRAAEDLCDRLTDNPFVDAADIEVGITGTEVTLNGTVNDPIALRQAQAIAEEVAGVTHVHNRLQLRPAGEHETTPGDAVNAALGTGGNQ